MVFRSDRGGNVRFQSTRPVRGATARHGPPRSLAGCFNPRAPCGARPASTSRGRWSPTGFNPRAPCGARPGSPPGSHRDTAVSIHAPRAGRDPTPARLSHARGVSIHAPRAGRDTSTASTWSGPRSFNPRAPCGARPAPDDVPTLTTRGFNPRAPCGARLKQISTELDRTPFQSTRPVRGATQERQRPQVQPAVSIHAPRAGRDLFVALNKTSVRGFQSTRPVRGATACGGGAGRGWTLFQSTRPVRGATHDP